MIASKSPDNKLRSFDWLREVLASDSECPPHSPITTFDNFPFDNSDSRRCRNHGVSGEFRPPIPKACAATVQRIIYLPPVPGSDPKLWHQNDSPYTLRSLCSEHRQPQCGISEK